MRTLEEPKCPAEEDRVYRIRCHTGSQSDLDNHGAD